MDLLPPETQQNPEIDEPTPLLPDNSIEIDPELYAIGGAVGFASKPFHSLLVDDMNLSQMITPEGDGFINTSDFKPLLTEVGTSHGQQIPPVESAQEHDIVTKKVIGTLFSVWLKFAPRRFVRPERQDSELFSPRAQHAMFLTWRVIKTKTGSLPDSDVIAQGLAGFIVEYMHRLQLMRPEGKNYVMHENFKERVTDIVRKRWKQILVDDSLYQHEINSIVETMFSTWLEYNPSNSDESECEDNELFSPEALDAMSAVWQQITAERDFLPDSNGIVEGLATSMVDYMDRSQMMLPVGEEPATIEDFKEHVTDIVRKGWQQILDKVEKEERDRKMRERRKMIRKQWRKRREAEDLLLFYKPLSRMKHEAPMDCRLCCIFLCNCFSAFFFQVLIHTLLLAWPLSIGIMGGFYLKHCPMNYLMPYMMMAVGAAGTTAILVRLSYVFYEKSSGNEINQSWPWILLKLLEYLFLSFIIIHLYCFYSSTPSFDLGSAKYCNKTFYDFVHWINYVSVGLASTWLLVYFIKLIIWFHIRKFPLRPRW